MFASKRLAMLLLSLLLVANAWAQQDAPMPSAPPAMPTSGPQFGGMIWMPWLRPSGPEQPIAAEQLQAAQAAFLAYFDVDGNGCVSAEELAEQQTQWVQSVDTDGDGSITREEMQAVVPRPPGPPRGWGHRPPPGMGQREGQAGSWGDQTGQPSGQTSDASSREALKQARQALREAQASGDKAAIEKARAAFWAAHQSATGNSPPAGW